MECRRLDPPTVVFDIGSTLVHPNLDVLAALANVTDTADRQTIARAFSYALEAALRALPEGDEAARQGLEFFRYVDPLRHQDATAAKEVWLKIQASGGSLSPLYTELDPDAHAVLGALHNSGCVLIAASNSNGTLEAELKYFQLTGYFDHLVDSHDLGYEKPNERFFAHVLTLRRKADPPPETWYVGNDLVRDIVGALVAGFDRAVLYDRADAFPRFVSGYRLTKLSDLIPLVLSRRS